MHQIIFHYWSSEMLSNCKHRKRGVRAFHIGKYKTENESINHHKPSATKLCHIGRETSLANQKVFLSLCLLHPPTWQGNCPKFSDKRPLAVLYGIYQPDTYLSPRFVLLLSQCNCSYDCMHEIGSTSNGHVRCFQFYTKMVVSVLVYVPKRICKSLLSTYVDVEL